MSLKEKVKKNINKVAKVLEQSVDGLASVVEETRTNAKGIRDNFISDFNKGIYNSNYKNLTGTKVFEVYFTEYVDSKQSTNIPVYYSSTIEGAIQFCKNHTDYAVKFEDDNTKWWFFYVNKVSLNEEIGSEWVCTLDWNGQITDKTYFFDKGYNTDYTKDKIILEQQNPCEKCVEAEVDEETKINEKSKTASVECQQTIKKLFYDVKDLQIRVSEQSGWFTVLIISSIFNNKDFYVYDVLTNNYGTGANNRLLFYFGKPK